MNSYRLFQSVIRCNLRFFRGKKIREWIRMGVLVWIIKLIKPTVLHCYRLTEFREPVNQGASLWSMMCLHDSTSTVGWQIPAESISLAQSSSQLDRAVLLKCYLWLFQNSRKTLEQKRCKTILGRNSYSCCIAVQALSMPEKWIITKDKVHEGFPCRNRTNYQLPPVKRS